MGRIILKQQDISLSKAELKWIRNFFTYRGVTGIVWLSNYDDGWGDGDDVLCNPEKGEPVLLADWDPNYKYFENIAEGEDI